MLSLKAHESLMKEHTYWVGAAAFLIGVAVSGILSISLLMGKVSNEKAKLNELKVKYEKLEIIYEKQSKRIRHDGIASR